MPAEARISPIWKKQKLFVALFLFAVAAWFCFDGAVGYPRANVRYKEWKSYVDAGREKEWPERAKELGIKNDEWLKWVEEHHPNGPLPDERWDSGKRFEQFGLSGLAAIFGAITLAYWATQIRRTVRTDAEAVYTAAGTRVPFGAITGVGKKRWEKKGIAVVRYELGGQKKQFVVDDYKFDTEPSRKILAEIEERLIARTNPL